MQLEFDPNDEMGNVFVNGIDGHAEKLTRPSTMLVNVGPVKKPLAFAVKVAEAGNATVLNAKGGYIQSEATGERMLVSREHGTFVMYVEYENGDIGVITLDSGAGVSVGRFPWGLARPASE